METVVTIGSYLGQETTLPLWGLWFIIGVLVFLGYALSLSLKALSQSHDMVNEWRTRYDAVMDLLQPVPEATLIEEEVTKKKSAKA